MTIPERSERFFEDDPSAFKVIKKGAEKESDTDNANESAKSRPELKPQEKYARSDVA